ncbi:MAG TPA: RecX family transcriptional regulator [Microbacteriaceae bacterium]|nr:RecX family transcriptional regulator [Microbacteriaceae bacterium]
MGELIPMFQDAAPETEAGAPRADRGTSEEGFSSIEDASLKALGRRGMSRRELERVLGTQGYQEFAIADELERLESVGLIDDYALAQHLVAHFQDRKGLAGAAIKAELVRRVVAPGAIAYAMDLIDTADELAMARELAAKRARQYGTLDAVTVERRLTAFLLRRGFSSTTVRAAIASVRSA